MPAAHDTVALRQPVDGGMRLMLIGGAWVGGASATLETRNPATRGDCSPRAPRRRPEDIDRAVAAARRAFEGPWSRFKPHERQVLLLKVADLLREALGGRFA